MQTVYNGKTKSVLFDELRNIYVADEITPDIWRVKDESGNIPNQIECAGIIMKLLKEVKTA